MDRQCDARDVGDTDPLAGPCWPVGRIVLRASAQAGPELLPIRGAGDCGTLTDRLEGDVPELGLAPLTLPDQLIDSMTTDAVVGLLLLRMRALIARGFEPTEAHTAAAGLNYVI